MYEKHTYFQVEDVLNKKKPPPQILDFNGMFCPNTKGLFLAPAEGYNF